MNNERNLLIALNSGSNITRGALCRLAEATDLWVDAVSPSAALAAQVGVPLEPLRRALAAREHATEVADRETEQAAEAGCEIDTVVDESYPARLRELALPPPVLYRLGALPVPSPAIAIVGSRKPDVYGREVAEVFGTQLAAAGVTVVSGFARGVDAVAHGAALTAPGGQTVAVLGCGLDIDYPRRQSGLKAEIATRGAVLSEFPLGTEPRPWHFPIRNRVIAALADATLVIQARERSGSLSTAHHAMELGRDVFAVPGRIFDDLARGTNGLIADGAQVALATEDVLLGLSITGQQLLFPTPTAQAVPAAPSAQATVAAPIPPSSAAGSVLALIEPGNPTTADDLARHLDLPVDKVLGLLVELELGGWVRREPGPVYARSEG